MMRFLKAAALVTALTLVCVAAKGPVKVSGKQQQNMIVKMVKPVYPPEAKEAGVEGTVKLRVTISEQGKVAHLETISGHQLLTPAAVEAVKQWEYRPTILNGEPVSVLTDVDVNFTLAK
jgi:protein TonB